MGPLVPDIISSEFNFIIAFIIGVFFGLALEQAGFSSTKKLVGLFYGNDFTVLKVFFTAGITAMVGVLLLSHFGMLDMRLVYINPTFLNSAIIGGLIMGGGFIMGGFCPGTSIAAAAVGKLDAWAFIGGSLIGVFAFTESYPLIKDMYMANNLGEITISSYLGIAPELFAVILTLVALAAFYFTGKIEDNINGIKINYHREKMIKYALVAIVPFLLVSFVSVTPDRTTYLHNKAENQLATADYKIFDIDHLADELAHKSHQINLIDVRTPVQFKEFKIPTAVNIPLDSMLRKEYSYLFKQPFKINVFYAEDAETAKKAYLLAREIGNADNYVVTTPASVFQKLYFEPEIPGPDASKSEKDQFKFRIKIGTELKAIEKRLENLQAPVKKEIKKVKGGCA